MAFALAGLAFGDGLRINRGQGRAAILRKAH